MRSWRRWALRGGRVALLILTPLAVAGAVWAAWVLLPSRAVDDSKFEVTPEVTAKDGNKLEEGRLKARNDTRVAAAQVLGVLAIVVGGLATWWTVRLTREGQITDRYASAIEHLGETDKEPAMRLGAIYGLERIARDSSRDHWPIIEILLGHVRQEAPRATSGNGEPVAADVQAIATVLSRRKAWREGKNQTLQLWRLGLRSVRLDDADLRRANFADSDLSGAWLERVRLQEAYLEGAVLRGSHLQGAKLNGAKLARTTLVGADLRGAEFDGAEMVRETTRFYEALTAGAKGLPEWAIEQARRQEPPRSDPERSGDTRH